MDILTAALAAIPALIIMLLVACGLVAVVLMVSSLIFAIWFGP